MNDPYESRTDAAESEETATLAALGFLTAAESKRVDAAQSARMAEAAALLAETTFSVSPAPSVRNRLMSRVGAWETLKPVADVRPYDGGWVSAGVPGVEILTLFRDPKTRRTTFLMRMEPGGRFPAHRHHDDEQCYVLKGDIRWGEVVYEEGDFVAMSKDTTHPEIYSVGGNLLLLIAGHNELRHA